MAHKRNVSAKDLPCHLMCRGSRFVLRAVVNRKFGGDVNDNAHLFLDVHLFCDSFIRVFFKGFGRAFLHFTRDTLDHLKVYLLLSLHFTYVFLFQSICFL